jgi:hypothetical protein
MELSAVRTCEGAKNLTFRKRVNATSILELACSECPRNEDAAVYGGVNQCVTSCSVEQEGPKGTPPLA